MLVSDILLNTARSSPNSKAVWFGGEWRSFRETANASLSFANFLREKGLKPGDRVAILIDNSFDYIISHFGILIAGGVEVSLNTELSETDIRFLLKDCEATALISSEKYAKRWMEIFEELSDLRFVIRDARIYDDSFKPILTLKKATNTAALKSKPRRHESALASIVYTSGSTGKPKGVMLSHKNLVSNMVAIAEYLSLSSVDRMLVVLPFHYIYGRSLLYTHFLTGGSIVIDNRFAFPSAVLKTMEEQEVTCFAGVPSNFSILMRKTDFAKRSFPKLRMMTQAGGPMPPSLQKEIVETIAPADLWIMYGSTEAAPRLTYQHPKWIRKKWGSIGQTVAGVEIVVRGEDGNPVEIGEIGELTAKGPNIMMGYWKDEVGTAEAIGDGYYRTGDLGYCDEDGCYFLTGRARDIIKVGGNRVSSKEIEEYIAAIEGVVEVAVVGISDEILGEAIKAYISLDESIVTPKQIQKELQRTLPSFKQPSEWEILDKLPKNQSGKVMKNELKQRQETVDR